MTLIRRNNTIYIKRRVPRRFARVETRPEIWISLHTDAEAHAKARAPLVWQEMIEAWEAKLAGSEADGAERLEAAKELAAYRGLRYLPARDVAKLPLEEIVARVESVVNKKGEIDVLEAEAALGGAPVPRVTVTGALDRFWKIAADRAVGKSDDQIRRWKNPRKKAIAAFVDAVGDLEIGEITTSDLMTFRNSLSDRLMAGEIGANSANKDLIHLLSTIRDVARGLDVPLKFNADRIMFKQGEANTRPPFSVKWITDKLLAPGALDGLNAEARCIMLGMVNTGYRPSEGAMLTAAQIRLDAEVPHIKIEPVGRTLKTNHSRRIIPLTGISLTAFQQFPNGFPRYADNPTLSDTINKFLRENGLMESERHTLYSLRHSFEDRMLAAGVDERIRRDLMGHALNRERYGSGADLKQLQELLLKIAL
jgi:integrase